MKKLISPLTGMAALCLAGFVLTHLGDYPQIMTTWWFTTLAMFVALNTIGFALYAVLKLGYQSGRSLVNTQAEHSMLTTVTEEREGRSADARHMGHTAELTPAG